MTREVEPKSFLQGDLARLSDVSAALISPSRADSPTMIQVGTHYVLHASPANFTSRGGSRSLWHIRDLEDCSAFVAQAGLRR
jgi:hypothetical protein